MPVYRYACGTCQREEDAFRSIANRRRGPVCHGPMKIVICAAFVQDDIPAYVSPTTGRVIGSRKTRRDDLARSDARPWEGMAVEKQEARRRLNYAEQKMDAKLEVSARKAFHELPPEKRKALEGR